RVELAQLVASLYGNDILNQAAVFPVLIDVQRELAFLIGDQGDLRLSDLGRSLATGRLRDVDNIALLARERHDRNEVRHDDSGLIAGKNLVCPQFADKRRVAISTRSGRSFCQRNVICQFLRPKPFGEVWTIPSGSTAGV